MERVVRLNNEVEIPTIGFGTWQLAEGEEAYEATKAALNSGYRLIDTAKIYGNEESIGSAVRDSDIDRQEIFITTKLWNDDQGYDSSIQAYQSSLERLDLDYVDLYLIHWPFSDAGKRKDSWRALSDLYADKKVKSVGVSNYSIEQIIEVLDVSDITPAVNQIEFHIFNYQEQKELVEFCQRRKILVEAYSPLAQSTNMQEPHLMKIADKLGKSPAQIMLRWCLQHGTVPLPRSSKEERIKENMAVYDFELEEEDMHILDSLSI